MKIALLHDKNQIANYYLDKIGQSIYELGDLDDFYFPYTIWYGNFNNAELTNIALIYRGTELAVLLAHDANDGGTPGYVDSLLPYLPERLYAHLSPGMEILFSKKYQITSHGRHWKMLLTDSQKLMDIDVSRVIHIGAEDLNLIRDLYTNAYPGNWFDERMLNTGMFFGICDGVQLISAAGIHVFSPEFGVAAIGNITTLPAMRGLGLGKSVTARLCQELLKQVPVIGLNVLQDNQPAIACYKRLGFEIIDEYEEFMLDPKCRRKI